MTVALLIVDPQVDFHPPSGSLAVPGADHDAERVAALIEKNISSIDAIFVTLDSHHALHIGHPLFWKDGATGEHPAPMTFISAEDVKAGKWVPVGDEYWTHCKDYCAALEKTGKFTHTIWPYHCLIGTIGYTVHPTINGALQKWALENRKCVSYTMKGTNPLTEHFSVFKSEVPIPSDPATHLNTQLLDQICSHDKILVCGQALSHCVNHSIRDLVGYQEKRDRKRVTLMRDCTSHIPGFEAEVSTLLDFLKDEGCSICQAASELVL